MTSKHTPGPWTVKGKQSIRGPNGEYIGKTNWSNGEANARLIAAAPDLLDALRDLLNVYVELADSGDCGFWDSSKNPQVIAARAAIAKAEGEDQ